MVVTRGRHPDLSGGSDGDHSGRRESPYVAKKFELLNQLAKHVRGRYGVPVFQWYTDPLPPHPKQIADGWVFDAYKWTNPRFRRHLMKFVVLGKPVIAMPWAADPDDGYFSFKTGRDLICHTDQQFRVCMEFNVPVAIYAVSGGSVNNWLGRDKPELETVRKYVYAQHAAMKAIPAGLLPLPTADFSHGTRIEIVLEE